MSNMCGEEKILGCKNKNVSFLLRFTPLQNSFLITVENMCSWNSEKLKLVDKEFYL